MADAIIEQIMDYLVGTMLAGLTTTGSDVIRGLIYPIDESVDAALSVFMGPDDIKRQLQSSLIDWESTIIVRAHVRTSAEQIDQLLNTIRKEVHAAIMDDETINGLVSITTPIGASEPELLDGGEKPVATMDITFDLQYRTTRADISASA